MKLMDFTPITLMCIWPILTLAIFQHFWHRKPSAKILPFKGDE